MIGVSPAFFFSLYSTDFSLKDYGKGLDILGKEGFSHYQLEIYKTSKLGEWEKGCKALKSQSDDMGLQATQFVAHFLHEATADAAALLSDFGFEELKRVVGIASNFPECKTITVPILPFSYPSQVTPALYETLWKRLEYKLATFADIAAKGGYNLALEIVPGSLLNNSDGLLRVIEKTTSKNLGYNFDTGHAINAGEAVLALPAKLATKMYGTHLKDTSWTTGQTDNRQAIDWTALLKSLSLCGYTGSLDLEIPVQDPTKVQAIYQYAKQIIEQSIDTIRRDL